MWMEAFGTIGAWLCRVALLGLAFSLIARGPYGIVRSHDPP